MNTHTLYDPASMTVQDKLLALVRYMAREAAKQDVEHCNDGKDIRDD